MSDVVLTVDPDIASWNAILGLLKTAGYETITANDFPLAVYLLATVKPDLLITVVRLGSYNGLHLMIRGRASNPRLAAFVVDESKDALLEAESKKLGATGYLVKPVQVDELLALITKALADRNRRHSSRMKIAGQVLVRVGPQRARVLDVSHGGIRLEFEPGSIVPPTALEIELPNGIVVKAECAWSQQADRHDVFWCGAAVNPMTREVKKGWRQLVQSLKDGYPPIVLAAFDTSVRFLFGLEHSIV
jgi:two-component system, chemotaxis family, chemotaxis protein CheY